jgi:hypothetical protein
VLAGLDWEGRGCLAGLAGQQAALAVLLRRHLRHGCAFSQSYFILHGCVRCACCAVEYIAAFLLVTTALVPFAFFLGISGDNAVLPGVSPACLPARLPASLDRRATT